MSVEDTATAATQGEPSFEETFARVESVEGWLSRDQAHRLWERARLVPPAGRIVEIGSFRGRSTAVLATAAPNDAEVVAIDPHAGSDRGPQEIEAEAERGEQDHVAFRENLRRAGVEDQVRHLRAMSNDALDQLPGRIDLLYVDGAHRYRPASDDIVNYGAQVQEGGTMLVHDAFNAIGVMLAQLRLLVLSDGWRYVGRSGSLAEYRRQSLSGRERLDNALRQLAGVPYFLRNLAIKVLLVARLAPLTRLLGHRTRDWPY